MAGWRVVSSFGLNQRERTVVLILAATFLAGSGIAWLSRARALRRSSAVVVEPATDTASRAMLASGPINLNTANARQLEALPDIGPVLAARIVAFRESRGGFRSVSQLREVSGIGPKRYSALKDLLTVVPDAGPGPGD
jgi:competence protein ComEA